MLPLHHDPVLGRAYAFQPCHHLLAPCAWFVPSGSPENRTQRHVVISRVRATSPRLPRANVVVDPVGMAGLEPASPCSQSTWVRRYPTSRTSVRTAGFEPAISCTPSRRDSQASLRSDLSSPCGSRTRFFGLKGPMSSTDRRTSRIGAHAERSGPGGARTLVCGFSGRRYTVSATSPTKKTRCHLHL